MSRQPGKSASIRLPSAGVVLCGVKVALLMLAGFFLGPVVSAVAQTEGPANDPVAADLRLPDLDRSALTPEKRDPTKVTEDERNPFGFVAPVTTGPAAVTETESEEDKLRRILAGMRIAGQTSGPGANSAMLGPILIREGQNIPRLFADQAEVLRVESISDREVVIVFVDKEAPEGKEPRTLNLPVDLAPGVRSVMVGEVFESLVTFDGARKVNAPPLKFPATDAYIEGVKGKDVELQSLVERSHEFMGSAASPSTQEVTDEDSGE